VPGSRAITVPPMGQRDEFLAAVQQAAAGTPYAVTPTDAGFDVALNIVDAEWYGLFNKAGLSKAYTHHVSVPEDSTYSITDDAREVEWVAGTPRVSATASRQVGRVKEFGVQKVWAFDENGKFGKVVDYRFNSEEGRDLITLIADNLGLKQERGTAEKIGLYVGLGTIAALLICGIVIGFLALAGAF
jgi:hypothetical protein